MNPVLGPAKGLRELIASQWVTPSNWRRGIRCSTPAKLNTVGSRSTMCTSPEYLDNGFFPECALPDFSFDQRAVNEARNSRTSFIDSPLAATKGGIMVWQGRFWPLTCTVVRQKDDDRVVVTARGPECLHNTWNRRVHLFQNFSAKLLFLFLLPLHTANLTGIDLGEHGEVDEERLGAGRGFDQSDCLLAVHLRPVLTFWTTTFFKVRISLVPLSSPSLHPPSHPLSLPEGARLFLVLKIWNLYLVLLFTLFRFLRLSHNLLLLIPFLLSKKAPLKSVKTSLQRGVRLRTEPQMPFA